MKGLDKLDESLEYFKDVYINMVKKIEKEHEKDFNDEEEIKEISEEGKE